MYGDNVFYLSTRPERKRTEWDTTGWPTHTELKLFLNSSHNNYVPTNPEQNGLITMIYIPTYTELKSKPFSQA